MKSLTLRWIALGLGLCAFALRLALVLWLEPRPLQGDLTGIMLTTVVAYAVSLGVPVAVLVYLVGFRLPARLEERPTALVAPPTPTSIGALVILVMWMMAGVILAARPAVSVTGIVLALLALLAAILAVVVDRPRVEFTADELILVNARSTTRVKWDRLAPGGPLPPHKRQRYLRIYLNEPPILGAYPPSVDIRLTLVYGDPAYLAETIRRYADNPAERAALPGGGIPQGAPST